MVTTLQIEIAGRQTRMTVEGDLCMTLTTASERVKLGNLIIKTLNKRGFEWASAAILSISPSGLNGRLEPAGSDHYKFQALPVRLSYSNLVDENQAPNIIRDWK